MEEIKLDFFKKFSSFTLCNSLVQIKDFYLNIHYIKKGLQYSLTKKKKITFFPQIIVKNKGTLKVRLRANNRQMTLT